MEFESQHVEWQHASMNQIAALSGGGLVASASLIWPKTPLPHAEIIAFAWGVLALATVTAVAANYLSGTGNAFAALHHYQKDQLPRVALSGKAEVEAMAEKNRKKAGWRTTAASCMATFSPWLFAGGVGLLAAWAILAILQPPT